MRLRLQCLWLVSLLVGCSGEGAAPPAEEPPVWPVFGGSFRISGGFDGYTAPEANFDGLVAFGQAVPGEQQLAGAAKLSARGIPLGATFPTIVGPLLAPFMTYPDGIRFTVVGPGVEWTFTGTVSGTTASGRHTLAMDSTTLSGDWSMYRWEPNPAALKPSTSRPAQGQCMGLRPDGTDYVGANETQAACAVQCRFCNWTSGTITVTPD